MAFGLAFDTAEQLIMDGYIEPTQQVFQAPGGATTKKVIYKIYYQYAYPLGITLKEPELVANYIQDRNGHILPYVRFEGGNMKISSNIVNLLDEVAIKGKE